MDAIEKAKEHFGKLIEDQLKRIEHIKAEKDWVDYSKLKPIIIGTIGGDGIGPHITAEAQRVLEQLLADEVKAGKIEFRVIEGLTIEKRSEVMKPVPDDVLAAVKKCHVTLMGRLQHRKKVTPGQISRVQMLRSVKSSIFLQILDQYVCRTKVLIGCFSERILKVPMHLARSVLK